MYKRSLALMSVAALLAASALATPSIAQKQSWRTAGFTRHEKCRSRGRCLVRKSHGAMASRAFFEGDHGETGHH